MWCFRKAFHFDTQKSVVEKFCLLKSLRVTIENFLLFPGTDKKFKHWMKILLLKCFFSFFNWPKFACDCLDDKRVNEWMNRQQSRSTMPTFSREFSSIFSHTAQLQSRPFSLASKRPQPQSMFATVHRWDLRRLNARLWQLRKAFFFVQWRFEIKKVSKDFVLLAVRFSW